MRTLRKPWQIVVGAAFMPPWQYQSILLQTPYAVRARLLPGTLLP